MKTNWGYHLTRARASRERPVGGGGGGWGGLPPEKIQIAILKQLLLVWSKNLLCMLEISFYSFLPGDISIFFI